MSEIIQEGKFAQIHLDESPRPSSCANMTLIAFPLAEPGQMVYRLSLAAPFLMDRSDGPHRRRQRSHGPHVRLGEKYLSSFCGWRCPILKIKENNDLWETLKPLT